MRQQEYDLIVITDWAGGVFRIPNWALSKTGEPVESSDEQDILLAMSLAGWKTATVVKEFWPPEQHIYTWLYFERTVVPNISTTVSSSE